MTARRSGWIAAAAAVAACNVGSRNEPTIASITPDTGPAQGGTMITVAGTDLTDHTTTPLVLVGTAQGVVLSSTDNEIVFMLPPGVAESTVDVTVSDAHGFATAPSAFTYNPLPVALMISPEGGPGSGGTAVTITGRGFSDFNAGAVTLTIGGAAATGVQVLSDQMVTAVTGAVPAGTPPFTALDVVVTDTNGIATLPAAYSTTKQGLLMISRNDETLSYFDPTTSDSVSLGQLVTRLHGCVLAPDNTIYAEGRSPVGEALYKLDPLSGSAAEVGPTNDATSGGNYPLSSLAFVGSTLYGFVDGPCCSSDIKRLASVDLATGSATLIGGSPVTAQTTRGMTIGTRDVATVFYAETTNSTLDTINITTGVRATGPTISNGQNARARAIVTIGATLYLLEEGNPATLYTINPVSGALGSAAPVLDGNISMCVTPTTF